MCLVEATGGGIGALVISKEGTEAAFVGGIRGEGAKEFVGAARRERIGMEFERESMAGSNKTSVPYAITPLVIVILWLLRFS